MLKIRLIAMAEFADPMGAVVSGKFGLGKSINGVLWYVQIEGQLNNDYATLKVSTKNI